MAGTRISTVTRYASGNARRLIFWSALLTRILLCGLVLEHSLHTKSGDIHLLAMIWIGWTCFCGAMSVAVQYFPPTLLRLMLGVDVLILSASTLFLPGLELALVAMGITLSALAITVGTSRAFIFTQIASVPIVWLSKDLIQNLVTFRFPIFVPPMPFVDGISALLQLIAVLAILLCWIRSTMLKHFAADCMSLSMLMPERNFEFDLQLWIESLSLLYLPDRALCVMTGTTNRASKRMFESGMDGVESDSLAREVLDCFEGTDFNSTILDIEAGTATQVNQLRALPLNEAEQRLALILKRSRIFYAMVFPLKLDRSQGGIVCAISGPTDNALIQEMRFLDQEIRSLERMLNRVASAERAIMADARDVARRDLHDGVLQSLAALRMRLLMITKRKEVAGSETELELRKTVDILTLEQSRLRGFLERSESDHGLVNLVTELDVSLRGISLQWEIDVKLQSDEPAIPIDADSARNIEHLMREVMANAVRHAHSRTLTVSLSLRQDALMLVVNDRKHGESVAKEEGGSLPLDSASLRQRLRIVNGKAYVDGLERGALLAITIPMQQVDDA